MGSFLISIILIPYYLLIPLQESDTRFLYKFQEGNISFKSNAPLEIIMAESDGLRGIIDPSNNTFAFTVSISSFHGFNGPLQKEHFNENYMETDLYPAATFIGKIIEDVDYLKNGNYEIRAKGLLNIHGVKQERIIKSQIEITEGKIHLKSIFLIALIDHNIRIPKVVYQKIAPDIEVTIEGTMLLTKM